MSLLELPTDPDLWVGLAILFGLTVGSFLNVCIYRVPLGKSVVHPGSACPRCRGAVAWHDNIPLLSYLWLRGRCRHCATSISPRYPLVEAVNGALWGGIVLRFGLVPAALLFAGFASAILVLVLIDLEHQLLPNVITLPGVAIGLGGSFLNPLVTPAEAFAGAALGYGLPWAIGRTYKLLRGRDGIGMGDFKMLAMVGSFFGWQGVLFTLGMGSILGTLIGVPWALATARGLKIPLPFGTFLGVAAVSDLFGARSFVVHYLGLGL
jgi:leader peptidase (prepilin peptidase)/N-methyltransferase